MLAEFEGRSRTGLLLIANTTDQGITTDDPCWLRSYIEVGHEDILDLLLGVSTRELGAQLQTSEASRGRAPGAEGAMIE